MVCTGLAAAALKASLIVWMAADRLNRNSVLYWRPDRSHVFGPRRLPELSRSVEIPPLELLRQNMPAPVVAPPPPGLLVQP